MYIKSDVGTVIFWRLQCLKDHHLHHRQMNIEVSSTAKYNLSTCDPRFINFCRYMQEFIFVIHMSSNYIFRNILFQMKSTIF